MKKIISMLLCLVVLVCAFCMAISGTDDIPKPVGPKELTMHSELPTIKDPLIVDLTEGLTTPAPYSPFQYAAESLSEYDQWELNRYLTYGLTVNGIHALKRPLSTMIDNVWTVGGTKYNDSKPLTNGQQAYGAFEAYFGNKNNVRYNVKGETGKTDSIYEFYMTFNFGKLAAIDSFGFMGNSYGNQLAVFDVYVSSDGENWTCLGYADQVQRKIDEINDYSYIDAKLLGEDIMEKVYTASEDVENACGTNGRLYLYDLDGVEAQFLRVCSTVCQRKAGTDPALAVDPTDYNNYPKTYEMLESLTWREMVVYGTLLDKENTVTATEPAAPQTTELTTFGGDSLIPAKPSKTTAAEPTAAPETTVPETTAEEKSGCGSSIGVSMIAVAITAVGATTVAFGKKKRK